MTRTYLDKQAFLSGTKRRYKDVELITGGTVRIQSLTSGEMRRFKASLVNKRGELDRRRSDYLQELLIARCLVDDKGSLMFSESEAMAQDFSQTDGAMTNQLFNEIKEHTNFSSDSDFVTIENEVKNSQATDAGSSS